MTLSRKKNAFRRLVWLVLWILPSVTSAQDSLSVTLLSYNIHGLPELLVGNHGQYKRIGNILRERRAQGTAPQIVALQEAWEFHGSAKELIKRAGYPYVARGRGTQFGRFLTSGIYILSEYPIEAIHRTTYSSCVSWDCAATKGALHVRVRIPGLPVPIDVYNTHLNSDPDSDPLASESDCREARLDQMTVLASFVDRTATPGSVVFAPGDFNSVVAKDELSWFAAFSRLQHVLSACSRPGSPCEESARLDAEEAIDHQFFRAGFTQGRAVRVRPVSYLRNFDELYKKEPLSDHLGLEVRYDLSW